MIQNIYFLFPPFFQDLFLSFFGFFNDLRRYGATYNLVEAEVLRRRSMSNDNLKKLQKTRLSSFFKNANKSPYWAEIFKKFDVDVDGNPYSEILKLPVLDKEEVRCNCDRIKINFPYQKLRCVHTSGSTGSGLSFYETQSCESERWAVWWRYRANHGIEKGTWCGLFGGRSIISPTRSTSRYHRFNYSSKQVLFSCYHLSRDTVGAYIDVIEKMQLKWLHGYPSFISELASLAISKDIVLINKPKYITLGAENLSGHQERIITDFFGVKPIQHYGLAESTANFSQDTISNDLIVDEDFSYVEFIKEGDIVKILGTNFSNPCFPLFRYDCGDIALNVNETVFPRRLASVDGRAEDFIVTPSGRKIGRLDHIFKDALFVNEAQIYQNNINSIDVRLVVNSMWDENSQQFLQDAFVERLEKDMKINFIHVDKIERTKTGKLRFVISEVDK